MSTDTAALALKAQRQRAQLGQIRDDRLGRLSGGAPTVPAAGSGLDTAMIFVPVDGASSAPARGLGQDVLRQGGYAVQSGQGFEGERVLRTAVGSPMVLRYGGAEEFLGHGAVVAARRDDRMRPARAVAAGERQLAQPVGTVRAPFPVQASYPVDGAAPVQAPYPAQGAYPVRTSYPAQGSYPVRASHPVEVSLPAAPPTVQPGRSGGRRGGYTAPARSGRGPGIGY